MQREKRLAMVTGLLLLLTALPLRAEQAIFASGCFWCTESDFEKVEGVSEAVSGYIGGSVENPSYHAVSAVETGHTEAVRVEFDPAVVSY